MGKKRFHRFLEKKMKFISPGGGRGGEKKRVQGFLGGIFPRKKKTRGYPAGELVGKAGRGTRKLSSGKKKKVRNLLWCRVGGDSHELIWTGRGEESIGKRGKKKGLNPGRNFLLEFSQTKKAKKHQGGGGVIFPPERGFFNNLIKKTKVQNKG